MNATGQKFTEREWNAMLELQLKNVSTLYDELNEAVVAYLEMRFDYAQESEIASLRSALAVAQEELRQIKGEKEA